MANSSDRWTDSLEFSSLFRPPPQDPEQWNAQVTAYVELLSQFISEQFPNDLAELIRSRYPCDRDTLFDDVLVTFVLHHPEHGRAVIIPIISCILDGLVEYGRRNPPFASFISLFCPKSKVYSEQLSLACGEILRILTHYNQPLYNKEGYESEKAVSSFHSPHSNQIRPLSAWITDILLEASLSVRNDYFCWCAGVNGTYAATHLKPPSLSCHGSGKHPLFNTSTPRWAVANGAAVILSVCDEEVSRYETAALTAAAVPAVLLPPATTPKDEHLVPGLPALEPYARLFHRYYAFASPSVTQELLHRLLDSPPAWAHYALEAAVQLVELLRAAEEHSSNIRLPSNWMYLHFLRAIGIAMYRQGGTAADAAAALLFRILSQPALLFPPLSQVDGIEPRADHSSTSSSHNSCIRKLYHLRELPTAEAIIEASAQGIASMLCEHGLEVEWRICMIWEAAYGLVPLNSSSMENLPEIIVATSLQPPVLSWSLYIPLLKVLEYLPRGSPSEGCLMKIFVATIEAILERTFPSKDLVAAELRTVIHSLFLGSCASVELASRLLFVALTVCASHEARVKEAEEGACLVMAKRGPIGAFDSYVIAAICALSCELQTYSLTSKERRSYRAVEHTRRMLAILEALLSLELSSIGTSWSYSSDEIVATVMVAAHVSDMFWRTSACMQALILLARKKWDKEIHSRATSLFNTLEFHRKTVRSIIDRAKPIETGALRAPVSCLHEKKCKTRAGFSHGSKTLSGHDKGESTIGGRDSSVGVMGFNCIGEVIRSVLVEKQELCFLVVSLLWHTLIASPEIQPRAESTSAQQGWRKVVDALSNVVSASPAKAATAVVLQAESELKPWLVNDNEASQEMWRINQRIVKVIAELMSNHDNSEALMILAGASDLLLRATAGILVDGEACILPQLELLEATARAARSVLERGEPGEGVADGISNLLKRRLQVMVGCVSHPSAHVRALSTSVLRAVVRVSSTEPRCSTESIVELGEAVEKCLRWEARSRLAAGLPIQFLEATAREIGSTISISSNLPC